MLNVILNESKIIKDAESGKFDELNACVTLKTLMKYYYLNDVCDRLQLKEQLLDFLKTNYKGYKRARWEDIVTKMVDRFLKTTKRNKIEVKIIDVNEVKITKQELENIIKLSDIKLEKLAFVMLVYAKISNIIMNNTDGWINISCSNICDEAKVYLKGNDKIKIFNDLYNLGYIEQRKHNAKTNIKVCYLNEKSEVELIISDFDGVVYQYLIWKGEKWKRCCGVDCGKWIKMNGVKDNSKKYCNICSKKENIRKTVENRKKFESKKPLQP